MPAAAVLVMESMPVAIGAAIAVFAATNIDDLFVLVAFLAHPAASPARVFLGQYIGIGALYAAGVACSLAAVVLPPAYVGLLGFLPIAVGVMRLRQRPRGDLDDAGTAARRASGQTLAVSSITIANGADNIGVYTSVFATRAAEDVVLFGVVFALMTGLWCLAARWLVNHRTAGAPIRRHARRVVPPVLIALGLVVLYEAGSFGLLPG